MIKDAKKVISILQLKFLIKFAQALFNPKGNSSKNLYTLEGIWGNSWERTYKGNEYIKSHCRCLTQLLMLNETSVSPSEGRVITPVLLYLGMEQVKNEKTQIKGMDTQIHP